MLRPSDRIFDRFATALGDAAHYQPAFAGVDVYLEVDGCENWFVKFLKCGGENLEDGGAGLGILAGEKTSGDVRPESAKWGEG
jgi:hypothetical protein